MLITKMAIQMDLYISLKTLPDSRRKIEFQNANKFIVEFECMLPI